MNSEADQPLDNLRRKMLSPKRLAFQVFGFLLGALLLAYCIKIAFYGDTDWSRIKSASPLMIAALLGTGLLGTILDGLVFWGIIRPYHRLKVMDIQAVNMSAACMNYAPVRLGTIFRILYHARVDRVPLVPILAWFGAIIITTAACLGSVILATLIMGEPGIGWAIILGLFLALSGFGIWILARIPLAIRYAKGVDKMFGDPRALVSGIVGRLLVLGNGCLRMAIAAQILGITLGTNEVILLSVAALMMGFNPLGRFGWREATVAFVTAKFASDSLGGQDPLGVASQLALVESAGEALIVIPIGIATSIWAFVRLLRNRPVDEVTNSPEAPVEDHRPA